MSGGAKLPGLVSGVAPLRSAIDGSPRPAERKPRKAPTKKPPVTIAAFCRRCDFRDDDPQTMHRHMTMEVKELEAELQRLRSDGAAAFHSVRAAVEIDLAAVARIHDHIGDGMATNTRLAYERNLRTFTAWCAVTGVVALPCSAQTLAEYVEHLWGDGKAPSTIDQVIATIRTAHRLAGLEHQPDTRAARLALRDRLREAEEAKQPPRGRGPSVPLQPPQLREVSAGCPDSLAGVRDRALVLLAVAIAGRRSELAALTVRDVTVRPTGLVVEVRPAGQKPRIVAVPYGSDPLTCPVRAWLAWVEAGGLVDPDSPAFRRIDRHGRLLGGMAGESVRNIIKRATARASGGEGAASLDLGGAP